MPGKYRCYYILHKIIVKDARVRKTFRVLNQTDASSVVELGKRCRENSFLSLSLLFPAGTRLFLFFLCFASPSPCSVRAAPFFTPHHWAYKSASINITFLQANILSLCINLLVLFSRHCRTCLSGNCLKTATKQPSSRALIWTASQCQLPTILTVPKHLLFLWECQELAYPQCAKHWISHLS